MTVPEPVVSSLVSATEEVFDTMLALPLVQQTSDDSPPPAPTHVVATVAFAGHRRGLVVLSSSLQAAKIITGSMLGLTVDEVNGEVPDAIGEVANMVAGTFRNRLSAVEPLSYIAVPTVTMGTDFSTLYGKTIQRTRCQFDVSGEPISVELILTSDAGSPG